jgi:CBS domain-containing protein
MATATPEGSYLTPSFENARVSDAMRPGVISCTPTTSLVTVAQIMATNHIHCVAVMDPAEGKWGVLTDLDLVAAGPDAADRDAGSAQTAKVVTVRGDDTLAHAAQLMTEQQTAHLIVVDESGRAAGFISSLDIAGVIAWGRG